MGDHEHALQLPESSQQVAVGNLLMWNEKCPGKQKAAECSPIWYLQNDNQSWEQYPILFPKIKKRGHQSHSTKQGSNTFINKESIRSNWKGLAIWHQKTKVLCGLPQYGPRQFDTSESFAVDLEPHPHRIALSVLIGNLWLTRALLPNLRRSGRVWWMQLHKLKIAT